MPLKIGEWTGIVRQLIDRRADLAVASMTINYARETVIDFTKPFMNLGISILFKAPADPETELFSFMNPLALEIWMYILFAYVLVSITIWIVARFSPYEWASPDPCEDTAGLVFQNDFTLPNSFWFAIGTLMQQGWVFTSVTQLQTVLFAKSNLGHTNLSNEIILDIQKWQKSKIWRFRKLLKIGQNQNLDIFDKDCLDLGHCNEIWESNILEQELLNLVLLRRQSRCLF